MRRCSPVRRPVVVMSTRWPWLSAFATSGLWIIAWSRIADGVAVFLGARRGRVRRRLDRMLRRRQRTGVDVDLDPAQDAAEAGRDQRPRQRAEDRREQAYRQRGHRDDDRPAVLQRLQQPDPIAERQQLLLDA